LFGDAENQRDKMTLVKFVAKNVWPLMGHTFLATEIRVDFHVLGIRENFIFPNSRYWNAI